MIVHNDGWELIGDLRMPEAENLVPVAIMLNEAAGNSTVYEELAGHLSERGIASLRLDLRGHGESTNKGVFVPGEMPENPLIWDSEVDVIAARRFIESVPGVQPDRIAVIGASYSGEEMAEAGRIIGHAQAYVALSPGSFSDESIVGIDSSGVPWLFLVSNNERWLKEIEADVRLRSSTVEMVVVPGTAHATRLLAHPGLAERIAVWLAAALP